ncbi:hypothetical protein EDD36DRAFT_432908 [Exophiala viscosa]|uniref:Uncharacterized protein n=1 Tax=Exophiala viscosa TaxID=2486360 RepID=A0AAN6E2J3_9EURO|nr:hypothetical protein EDD36DRAFT_432908 [Exophiala viscosa]
MTSEIDCCLSTSATELNARSVKESEEARFSSTVQEFRFQGSFGTLFHSTSPQAVSMALSPVANHTLILAILQHIFLRQQTWACSKQQNLSPEDIAIMSHMANRDWTSASPPGATQIRTL